MCVSKQLPNCAPLMLTSVQVRADEAEGADIMMVKPGMPYLDVVRCAAGLLWHRLWHGCERVARLGRIVSEKCVCVCEQERATDMLVPLVARLRMACLD